MSVPRFLLDTNVLSEATKFRPAPSVLKALTSNINTLATASVVYHELRFGWLSMPESRKKAETGDYIRQHVEDTLLILPYCERAASWHAKERSRLQQIGRIPPFIDGQIASIAAVNDLTLVTRNVKDFQHFQDLTVENWFD
ncbi:MAG: type II toxin-antitoxin system VapC family toxin [Cyanobacteria bacterium P01_F01_bin.53]